MKSKLINKTGKGKEIEMPKVFGEKVRQDILSKVYEVQRLAGKQMIGAKKGAGAGYSASGILKHRRHAWKTTYGRGISRIPRKIMSRHGASFNWIGATVASTRGGRRAHPPKSIKNLFKKINKKELLIAMASGFAGTIDEKVLKDKFGREVKSGFVFSDDVLKMKTKDFIVLLKKVFGGLEIVLKKKKIRAGKGKTRGRKYKSNAGLLFVIGGKEEMKRTGVDVMKVDELGIVDLAPGGVAGRVVGYSENAIKEIGEKFK